MDPVRDLETIQAELCAKDMEYLRKPRRSTPSALFVSTMDKVEEMLTYSIRSEWTTWRFR